MWIQAFGLSCLLTFLEAQRSTPAPYIPECNDMDTAARHLKTGIQRALRKNSDCKRNIHCTGVKCTWSGGGYLEVDLHHCHDPVNYHIAIKAPSKNLLKNVSVQEGDSINLFKRDNLELKLHVKKLSRTGNIVSTSVELEGCLIVCQAIASMVDQKFCVRMQSCPGFNASTADYKPCHFTPTSTGHFTEHSTNTFRSTSSGHSTTQSSSLRRSSTGHSTTQPSSLRRSSTGHSTTQPSSLRRSSTGHSTTQPSSLRRSSTGHSTTQPSSLGRSSTGNTSVHIQTDPDRSTSSDFPATGNIDARKGGSHEDDSLSTGAIIGICAAGVFAILVVIGAVVYWKKYHHRSRLRAAYYNDISMHEPLYEDFGPEVA